MGTRRFRTPSLTRFSWSERESTLTGPRGTARENVIFRLERKTRAIIVIHDQTSMRGTPDLKYIDGFVSRVEREKLNKVTLGD